MCCWKSLVVCTGVIVFSFYWTGFARAEAILRLEHAAKGSETKRNLLSTSSTNEEMERRRTYLLDDRRPEVFFLLAESKMKVSDALIHWDQKHAKKIKAKGLKLAHKPPRSVVTHELPAVSELSISMAASATELPASVPAPKPLWAGLGMIGGMGLWRWLMGRRLAV
jgi:hypothetical protein